MSVQQRADGVLTDTLTGVAAKQFTVFPVSQQGVHRVRQGGR